MNSKSKFNLWLLSHRVALHQIFCNVEDFHNILPSVSSGTLTANTAPAERKPSLLRDLPSECVKYVADLGPPVRGSSSVLSLDSLNSRAHLLTVE